DVALTGTAVGNWLFGNAGHNVLHGGGGGDRLIGGASSDHMFGEIGNDLYSVDNAADVVDETGGTGTDIVQSTVSFSLADTRHVIGSVEYISLVGRANINGIGNDFRNSIAGNAGANKIIAGLGNDVLNGGDGHDMLSGGA